MIWSEDIHIFIPREHIGCLTTVMGFCLTCLCTESSFSIKGFQKAKFMLKLERSTQHETQRLKRFLETTLAASISNYGGRREKADRERSVLGGPHIGEGRSGKWRVSPSLPLANGMLHVERIEMRCIPLKEASVVGLLIARTRTPQATKRPLQCIHLSVSKESDNRSILNGSFQLSALEKNVERNL